MQSNAKKTTDSYNRLAEDYEKKWSDYLDHTHQRLLKELQTTADDIILDPSCGTGLLTRHLVEAEYPFTKLVLNDIAAEMQQKAKDRFTNYANISFSQQPVENLVFKSQTFTKVLCLNALHNYSEQQQAIKNFWDVLRSGGELYLLDWNNSGRFRPVNWMIKQWVPERIATRSLHEAEKLLENAGFQIINKKEWYYKYWKFYFIKADKQLT